MAMDLEMFLRVVKTVVGVLGITGNSVVCLVIYKVQSLQTLTYAFIFNQAVADLFGSAIFLLNANIAVAYPPGALGVVICRLWASKFVLWVFLAASTLNLTAVTMERYFAIVFPFRYQAMFGRTQAVILIVGVWLMGSLIASYTIFNMKIDGDTCIYYPVPGAHVLGILIPILVFFLPLLVMIAAYSHIAITLTKSAGRIAPQPRPRVADGPATSGQPVTETQADSLLRARRNTLKTLFIVFLAFVVCWTPNMVFFVIYNFNSQMDVNGAFSVISKAFVVANSCVNPFIYALKYRSFQDGLRKMIGRQPRREEAAFPASSIVQTTTA